MEGDSSRLSDDDCEVRYSPQKTDVASLQQRDDAGSYSAPKRTSFHSSSSDGARIPVREPSAITAPQPGAGSMFDEKRRVGEKERRGQELLRAQERLLEENVEEAQRHLHKRGDENVERVPSLM